MANAPGLYQVVASGTPNHQDLDQLVQTAQGALDPGAVVFAAPLGSPGAPSVALQSGNLTGAYSWAAYWITGGVNGTGTAYVNGRTPMGTATATQTLSSQQAVVSVPASPPSQAIGWGLCRTLAGGSVYYKVAEAFLPSIGGTWPQITDDSSDATIQANGTPQTNNTTGTPVTFGAGATVPSGQTLSMAGATIGGAPSFPQGIARPSSSPEVIAQRNLLPNGDFSLSFSGWGNVNSNGAWSPSTETGWSIAADTNFGLHLITTTSEAAGSYQTIDSSVIQSYSGQALVASGVLHFSGTASGSGGLWIELWAVISGSPNTVSRLGGSPVVSGGSQTLVSVSATMPANTIGVWVRLVNGNGTSYGASQFGVFRMIALHDGTIPLQTMDSPLMPLYLPQISLSAPSNSNFYPSITWPRLQIQTPGTDAAIAFNNTGTGGRNYWWDSGAQGSGVGAGNFGLWDATAGALRFWVDSSGVGHFGGALHALSDAITFGDTVGSAAWIDASGNVSGRTYTSTVATGTAPLSVASTTEVPNLNAGLWGGAANAVAANIASPGSPSPTSSGVGTSISYHGNRVLVLAQMYFGPFQAGTSFGYIIRSTVGIPASGASLNSGDVAIAMAENDASSNYTTAADLTAIAVDANLSDGTTYYYYIAFGNGSGLFSASVGRSVVAIQL